MRKLSISLLFLGIALTVYWLGEPYLPTLLKKIERYKIALQETAIEPKKAPLEDESTSIKEPIASTETSSPATLGPPQPKIESTLITEAMERASTDPAQAMQWIQSQANSAERVEAMLAVVAQWAAEDANSALLWLENNAGGIARMETLNSGVALWSQQDPQAASEWVSGMANDGSKVTAARALVDVWGSSDPNSAAKWVESITSGVLRSEAAHSLIETWIDSAPQEAANWSLAQSILTGNDELMETALTTLAEKDPEAGAAFLATLEGVYKTEAAERAFIQRRADLEPAQTAKWLESLPSDSSLNSNQNRRLLLQSWALSDSVGASIWLDAQAPGPKRDASIEGFVATMTDFEPEAAAFWSLAISNESQRTQTIETVVKDWAVTDPDRAIQWIQSTELPPTVRNQLADSIKVN